LYGKSTKAELAKYEGRGEKKKKKPNDGAGKDDSTTGGKGKGGPEKSSASSSKDLDKGTTKNESDAAKKPGESSDKKGDSDPEAKLDKIASQYGQDAYYDEGRGRAAPAAGFSVGTELNKDGVDIRTGFRNRPKQATSGFWVCLGYWDPVITRCFIIEERCQVFAF